MVDEATEAAEEDAAKKASGEAEEARVAYEDKTKEHSIQGIVASSKRPSTATPKMTATTVSIIRLSRTWLIHACHV